MKIYFCPECGTYDIDSGTVCEDCDQPIPTDSWAELSDEDLAQLDYAEEFELPPGLPSWEYEVMRLKAVSEDERLDYTTHLLSHMGDKGWELISIVPMGESTGAHYGVFKRAWLEDI